MSKSFKGLDKIQALISDGQLPQVSIRTVSCEPSWYQDGQFYVDRAGFEDALIALFDAYAPQRDNSWREYGEDFENDVFRVRYDRQDGECSCGFSDEAEMWHENNKHLESCYQERLRGHRK